MFAGAAYAQGDSNAGQPGSGSEMEWLYHPLFWTEAGLLVLVLLAAPIYAVCRSRSGNSAPLKGLDLPEGSVRAMLALLIVGSFVNVLLFGAGALGDSFEQVVTAFGTLAGAVTGFYFAGRKSGENQVPPVSNEPDAGLASR